jgi:hypothetical protein
MQSSWIVTFMAKPYYQGTQNQSIIGPPQLRNSTLTGENKELWLELCEQAAAVERDPRKLHALIKKINRLLEEKKKPA